MQAEQNGATAVAVEEESTSALEITEAAQEKIRAILSAQTPPLSTLRISASAPGKYAMNGEPQAAPNPDDTVLPFEGFEVYVDPTSRPMLEGVTLSWVDTYGGGGFQFGGAGGGRPRRKSAPEGPDGAIWRQIEELLEAQVNPAVASHGGHISLIDYQDGTAYVEMGGGCQGCGMASVTLKAGVERILKDSIPEIEEVLDVTDHAGGRNPYYAPSAK